MDFGIYPPEINSGRMYTGPGIGPMLAAAQAWDALADELYTAASSYQSVVSNLADGNWSGPSSAAMVTAVLPYVAWLHTTATQAEETAGQAKAAIAAYEAAFASTVPPPVIATNRSLLMMLLATNFFGQNTPAIAATEAQYAEMWAQDAAAMYGYAASSASATALTPFTAPPPSTNPAGPASQATAAAQAAGTPAGTVGHVVSSAAQAFSVVSAAAAPPAATDPLGTLSNLITIFLTAPANLAVLLGNVPLGIVAGPVDLPWGIVGALTGLHTDDIVSGWNGEQSFPATEPVPPTEFPAIVTNPGAAAVSAGVGEANTIGALSVPPTWTVDTTVVRPVALATPVSNLTAPAAAAAELGSSSALAQMGLAGMVAPAMANTVCTGVVADERRKEMSGRQLAAEGKDEAAQSKPRTVVTGVAARIRQLATLRDEGRISDEEFREQKNRLLGR